MLFIIPQHIYKTLKNHVRMHNDHYRGKLKLKIKLLTLNVYKAKKNALHLCKAFCDLVRIQT